MRVACECFSTLVSASATFLKTIDSSSLGRSSGNSRSMSGSMPVWTRRVSRRSRIASLSPTLRSRASGLTVIRSRRNESSTFLMVAASWSSWALFRPSELSLRMRWSCSSAAVSSCNESSCRALANLRLASSPPEATLARSWRRAAIASPNRSTATSSSSSASRYCQTRPVAIAATRSTQASSVVKPRRES